MTIPITPYVKSSFGWLSICMISGVDNNTKRTHQLNCPCSHQRKEKPSFRIWQRTSFQIYKEKQPLLLLGPGSHTGVIGSDVDLIPFLSLSSLRDSKPLEAEGWIVLKRRVTWGIVMLQLDENNRTSWERAASRMYSCPLLATNYLHYPSDTTHSTQHPLRHMENFFSR